VAERLIAAISRPISVHKGVKVQVGATVGVTIAPEDGTSPRQLLHRADDALYYGKRIGKGRICFHRDLPLEGDRAGLERSAWSVLGQRSLEQSDL
jgi:predicted signal transduction protein with EAL and GGDEF domain